MEDFMLHLIRLFVVGMCMLIMGCSAFNTFNKYANGRFYEIYSSKGTRACDFKPKFNDCAKTRYFDIKISDDNNTIAFVIFVNQSYHPAYFGFTRDNFTKQTQPIRNFLLWAKDNNRKSKVIVIDNHYTLQYINTRADIPMLIMNVNNEHYLGFTYSEAENLLQIVDSWYNNTFTGIKIL